MNHSQKKWLASTIRWAVAVAGTWYVLANISWRDRVFVLDENNRPVEARLAAPAEESAKTVSIIDPVTEEVRLVSTATLVNEPDRKRVKIRAADRGAIEVDLLAADLDLTSHRQRAKRLLVADPQSGNGVWIQPSEVVGGYELRVPYPLVQAGLRHMLHNAETKYLWAAVLISPITFIITGIRWYALLRALGIHVTLARASIINMVGAFYNTFMPGSTGGDVLKAYYAAKLAPEKRTRAVMSVIIDRVIGLVALILIGGTMATLQWNEPATRQVAIISWSIIGLLIVGLCVFYVPALRTLTGFDFFLRKLPMQRQVAKAIDAMEVYRRRPGLVLLSVIMTFPVHITVIMSATFAGTAFGLKLSPLDYWVIVPVIVLAGSIPISPQGAGVMEFFAIVLTRPHGCTVAEAFALAMSIRIVQILWNLVGGIFVLRGGYHAPSEAEQQTMAEETHPEAVGVATK